MLKAFIGTAGIILFVSSILLGINLYRSELFAQSLDDEEKKFGIIDGPPLCSWGVQMPQRTMTEDKSQAIVISTSNPEKEKCKTTISLRAPGFDINPSKEEQEIILPTGARGSISWIITPIRTGTYEITVSDPLNTRVIGINVTNIFGLNALYAKLLSAIGGIFGPMMTIPWWWDRLRRKPKPQSQ